MGRVIPYNISLQTLQMITQRNTNTIKIITQQVNKQQINIFTNTNQLGPIIQIRIQVFPSRDMK